MFVVIVLDLSTHHALLLLTTQLRKMVAGDDAGNFGHQTQTLIRLTNGFTINNSIYGWKVGNFLCWLLSLGPLCQGIELYVALP